MFSSPSVTCILGIVILIVIEHFLSEEIFCVKVHLNEVTFGVRNEIAQGTLGRQKEDQVTLIVNVLSELGKRQEQFVRTEKNKKASRDQVWKLEQGNSNYPRNKGCPP